MLFLQGSYISQFVYDTTILYLLLLNETLAEGRDYRNGTLFFEKAKNRVFEGKCTIGRLIKNIFVKLHRKQRKQVEMSYRNVCNNNAFLRGSRLDVVLL